MDWIPFSRYGLPSPCFYVRPSVNILKRSGKNVNKASIRIDYKSIASCRWGWPWACCTINISCSMVDDWAINTINNDTDSRSEIGTVYIDDISASAGAKSWADCSHSRSRSMRISDHISKGYVGSFDDNIAYFIDSVIDNQCTVLDAHQLQLGKLAPRHCCMSEPNILVLMGPTGLFPWIPSRVHHSCVHREYLNIVDSVVGTLHYSTLQLRGGDDPIRVGDEFHLTDINDWPISEVNTYITHGIVGTIHCAEGIIADIGRICRISKLNSQNLRNRANWIKRLSCGRDQGRHCNDDVWGSCFHHSGR